MIKRKTVVIFLSIYIILSLSLFAYGALMTPFISRLAPAAALATGSGGGFSIPAKVIATTTAGANVASWISLAVPGATAAKVAIAILGVAGALASDYIYEKGNEWFQANNLSRDANGDFQESITRNIPNGYTSDDFPNGTLAANYNAALALCRSSCTSSGNLHCGSCGNYAVNSSYGTLVRTDEYYPVRAGHASPDFEWTYYYYPVAGTHPESTNVPVPPAALETKLANSLANENSGAKKVAKSALESAANAMENPANTINNNSNVVNNINNYLIQNITNNQLTNLEAAATPNVGDQVLPDTEAAKNEQLTAAQIAAAVAAALTNQGLSASQIAAAIAAAQSAATGGLTQAELASTLSSEGLTAAQIAAAIAAANPAITQTQVKTAVKEAIDDETGITPPVDPIISLPDKLSLTTILNDFWTSVQALPIFNVLNGITITTSGSSNLCIDLPSDYGGQRCYNAAHVQDELNMIGSVILGLTTVVSFIGIFKG